jgi:hypothetical protein
MRTAKNGVHIQKRSLRVGVASADSSFPMIFGSLQHFMI